MKLSHIFAVAVIALSVAACGTVKFNMSGASFGQAKTCKVNYFENRAEIVIPRLSSMMTDALKDKIQANSSLSLVNGSADVTFEGEITGYTIQPQAVTAEGTAAKDRLTVTVKVKFTNELNPEYSYDKSFSRFFEYASGTPPNSIESQAFDAILPELMDDIFNAAFSNW